MYQGIPSIGFPLFNLDVPTAGISISLSLDYNTESLTGYNLISDAGKGWNLSAIGSVIRNRTTKPDDYTSNNGINANSDVYQYTYPGGSGKFYIGTNTVNNELTGVHLSPSNDRIIITKDPAATGKVTSFTIIDMKGNRYLFDKVNRNIYRTTGSSTSEKITNSGFFLSRIFNVKNEETVAIEYETITQEFLDSSLQQQKIRKITVNGIGSIEYKYRNDGQPHTLITQGQRDWYIIERVILKDARNQLVNQYSFNNMSSDYLRDLIHLDKNGNPDQKFTFEYYNESEVGARTDAFGYPNGFTDCNLDSGVLHSFYGTNPATSFYGALQRVTLPTGGKVEYEFESNAYVKNEECAYNAFCYYDYHDLDKIYTFAFDTKSGVYPTSYTIPDAYHPGDLFVRYEYMLYATPGFKPGVSNDVILHINSQEGQPYKDFVDGYDSFCPEILHFTSLPFLNFSFEGYRKAHGTVEIYALKKARRDPNTYGYGLRIKSIKNFNAGSSAPVSYIRYDYNKFDDPAVSSGEFVDVSSELDLDSGREEMVPIGYENIKVTNMIDGSYSKYYYTPSASINWGFLPSSALTGKDMSNYIKAMGVLNKKEDFTATGQPLQKTEMDYQFKEVVIPDIGSSANPIKKVNISKQSSTTESYVSGTAKKLVASSETVFEDTYNNVSSTKETLADGTVTEKTFLYPADKGIQKLLTANMVNIPLETTVTRNGKLVGRAETKFDDPAHLYPTSVIAYNMQAQAPVTATRMEVYDNKGNLVQTRGKNGIPVTTLWGYYQTQPIAVIAGAAYADISSLPSVTAAVNASNADHDNPATEPQLVTALENLRKDPALQKYTVTCTTYDPMAGVTNSISANGIRTVNIYDASNRLIRVTDAAGKTLQEYQYHYKN